MTTAQENEAYGSFAKILAAWSRRSSLLNSHSPAHAKGPARMERGLSMRVHISIGMDVLALIVVRLLWRMRHGVATEAQLPRWQRDGYIGVHWLLYGLVFVTTPTGWFHAPARMLFVAPPRRSLRR